MRDTAHIAVAMTAPINRKGRTMKRLMLIAALLALAGCATPNELKQDGPRSEHRLRLQPTEAVKCLARNAEEFFGGFDAQIRENEVHVRGGDPRRLVAVAAVSPADQGSAATIWRTQSLLFISGLPAAMAKGC
jgi:hypothetical protein